MADNVNELLDWMKILGGLLMLDDLDDYPWNTRMHHGTLGMYLAGGAQMAMILKSLNEAFNALEEE